MSVTTLTKPRNRRQEIWNCLRGNKDRLQTVSETRQSLPTEREYGVRVSESS